MDPRLSRSLELVRAVVHEVRAENLPFMAASIAYHAFVSMLPLLLLVLAVLSTVGSPALEQRVIALVAGVLTQGASDVLVAELRAASASTGLSLLGAGLLLWGTLRIFRGLDTAFSDVYESETANTLPDQIGDGLLVLATVAGALVASAVVPAPGGLPDPVRRTALVLALAVALFPMYYVFPDVDLSPVEVVPGVLVTAAGLAAFQELFRYYVRFSARQPSRSTVAAILVFLTWLYVSGFVVLLGAVVNAVCANRSRDVNVDPLLDGPPRTEGDAPDRETVVEALTRVESLVADADPDTDTALVVGDERVVLPTPAETVAETERDRLRPGAEVTLRHRWFPEDEAGAADASDG
ncbi:MAG: YihY/virulence factor BrkB family protein [Haloferacaceae archaeon]